MNYERYFAREVEHAVSNLRRGAHPSETLHSRRVLHVALQRLRAVADPPWGSHPKDPRPFSSLPTKASVEDVERFVRWVAR